ncbi:MAG: FAD-dependent oxidoreductase [Thermodesulfobacteriota bacterium]|nr:FAD-dependent oxidoreductase [Thermodesulfobacteriota bacterium]
MSKHDYDIGIIGGGAAGLTVSSGAAQLGAKTLLIEKEPSLGGDCLHFGCVPSKTLIHSAKVYHSMKQGELLGLPKIVPPDIDFSQIAKRIQSVIDVIQVHDSVERFNKLGVEVKFGTPCFVDEHVVTLGSERISAKAWVIATGSSPAPPRISILNNISYITNKEIFSLERLPQSMIVLGAGPIAIEMAQAFCRLGTEVTVIQRSAQILSKEDKDMADEVMDTLAGEGIKFFLEATITEAEESGNSKNITIQQGEEIRRLTADIVLLAQGRSPNIDDLGLQAIDLNHTPRGIVVDNRMRTSHKHIYAPGDINGAFQFTHAAGYEGGIVVSNAIFHLPRKVNTKWMPWCTYTEPELASIGMNEKQATKAGIDYSVWTEHFKENDRALTEGETRGKLKMLLDKKERPIGVQILGPRAGDLIGEWVAVLGSGMKLSSLAGTIHPYPTLAEINKRVAGSFVSPKIFSPTVKKALKLIFRLQANSS